MKRRFSWVAMAVVLAAGCVFQIPSATYIASTRLISVMTSVTEFGPLYSSRPEHGEPVAEFLPGDVVAFDAVIVGADGLPLPAESISSMWMQCGNSVSCEPLGSTEDIAATSCAELETLGQFNSRSRCLLGTGDGRFEFVAPEFEEEVFDRVIMERTFYGVFAWDGGSAEECWQLRRTLDQEIENCAFIEHRAWYGPEWLGQLHAYEEGLEPSVPIEQIPAAVFAQPANRPPALQQIAVEHGGEVTVIDLQETPPPLPAVAIEPGSEIHVTITYDELLQLQQPIFLDKEVPSSSSDPEAESSYVFVGFVESAYVNLFTTNELHVTTEPFITNMGFDLFIEEQAQAGSSWMIFVLRDLRGGESVVWLEFTH